MTSITDTMAESHARCDELLARAESLAAGEDWQELDEAFEAFVRATEAHFDNEERVLFARAERLLPPGGPVEVMKFEHGQMRTLLASLRSLVAARDQAGILGEIETLLILMQQHNMKEEQILYPMLDRLLAAHIDTVLKELDLN